MVQKRRFFLVDPRLPKGNLEGNAPLDDDDDPASHECSDEALVRCWTAAEREEEEEEEEGGGSELAIKIELVERTNVDENNARRRWRYCKSTCM